MRQETTTATDPQNAAAPNPVREVNLPHYRAQALARCQSAALTERPFAERLVHFWSNHFAVSADKGAVTGIAGTLENEAIRPNVNRRFVDLLSAAEQHPAMIAFLDNEYSVGKDSDLARLAALRASWKGSADIGAAVKPKREFGINENLAREILELHTLGVRGGYTQADVTSFAQIITGWSIGGGKGRFAAGTPGRFYFRDNLHEPGAKTFMGKTYREAGVRQGEAALADLAAHPATAVFIATKLVRHFIADDPPPAAVDRIAHAFRNWAATCRRSGAALVESPGGVGPADAQVQDSAGLRAFHTASARCRTARAPRSDPQLRPPGPAAIHARVAGRLAGYREELGRPDALMHRAGASGLPAWPPSSSAARIPPRLPCASLGSFTRPETVAALGRASSSSQALALLLMSPEFQRR